MRQKLMLFYTGITRSADNVLKEQKKNTAGKLETLDFMKNQAKEMPFLLNSSEYQETFKVDKKKNGESQNRYKLKALFDKTESKIKKNKNQNYNQNQEQNHEEENNQNEKNIQNEQNND